MRDVCHGYNSSYYIDFITNRRISGLALQRKLGLLPIRRTGATSRYCNRSDIDGSFIKRTYARKIKRYLKSDIFVALFAIRRTF